MPDAFGILNILIIFLIFWNRQGKNCSLIEIHTILMQALYFVLTRIKASIYWVFAKKVEAKARRLGVK